jgi:redox-sensitive bicupin YhaK (pirin superfamily)
MIKIRDAHDRGHVDHGWLETYHTFSFANYHDPAHMEFRSLRVINEDVVQPGQGFGMHPHRDMEIITYILEGALEHKDNTGGGGVIRPGDVQYMCAGTGVMHSEFNHSKEETVHLLQIWIFPQEKGLEPSYAQRHFPREQRLNTLCPVAAGDGRSDALRIHQDAVLYASILESGQTATAELASGRHAWLQVARGELKLNGVGLAAGDGAAISEETRFSITAVSNAEFLFFDLA